MIIEYMFQCQNFNFAPKWPLGFVQVDVDEALINMILDPLERALRRACRNTTFNKKTAWRLPKTIKSGDIENVGPYSFHRMFGWTKNSFLRPISFTQLEI